MQKDTFVTVQYNKATGKFKIDFVPEAVDTKNFSIGLIDSVTNNELVINSFFVNPDKKKVSKPVTKYYTKPSGIPDFSLDRGFIYKYKTITNPNFCPAGWHVPTTDEFNTLANNLGGLDVAAGFLKSNNQDFWDNFIVTSEPLSLFDAVGTGVRQPGGAFIDLLGSCYYHCANSLSGGNINSFYLPYGDIVAGFAGTSYQVGLAVRLIKDDSILVDGIKDLDNNFYHTVKIGSQVWMRRNWKSSKLSNSNPIPNLQLYEDWTAFDSDGYCNYQ